jgi:hypothetical protein
MSIGPAVLASVTVAIALGTQTPAGRDGAAGGSNDRLSFMKDSVRIYNVTREGDRASSLKLNPEPVFRMGKQGAQDLEEGAIFVWTGAGGRPEAAIQVFLIRNEREPAGIWLHEFSSLSPRALTAARDGRPAWSPKIGGLEFKPLPAAPKPAASAAQRARQMRSLAESFRVSDYFKAKSWWELRLLTTPIVRYGAPQGEIVDGALFAFVLGTDPEAFLFLEARSDDQGLTWHFALAPMTVYALDGVFEGKPVWKLPDRQPSWDSSKPFFDCAYRP